MADLAAFSYLPIGELMGTSAKAAEAVPHRSPEPLPFAACSARLGLCAESSAPAHQPALRAGGGCQGRLRRRLSDPGSGARGGLGDSLALILWWL